MSDIIHLTADNFDTAVSDTDTPLLVDLWATWCGPCRIIAPVLEDLAGDYDGRLRIAKIDVDAEPALAQKFAVRSIPTLVFVHDGEVVETLVGAVPKTQIVEVADRVIASVGAGG